MGKIAAGLGGGLIGRNISHWKNSLFLIRLLCELERMLCLCLLPSPKPVLASLILKPQSLKSALYFLVLLPSFLIKIKD